jgi:hypothetical protein
MTRHASRAIGNSRRDSNTGRRANLSKPIAANSRPPSSNVPDRWCCGRAARTVRSLPVVSRWMSTGAKATAERRAYFAALPRLVRVPGAVVALDEVTDKSWRAANIRVSYPGRHLADLAL